MNKAMTALAFVFAFALCTKADGGVVGFEYGTSLENRDLGTFNTEDPDEDGSIGWAKAETNSYAIVTNYATGAAYDYAAHGTTRHFGGENEKYLAVDIDLPLERLAAPRNEDYSITSVPLKEAGSYDGIYADTLVKFSPSVAAPVVEETDKIIVWMREAEKGGASANRLVVTAGYYDGDFDNVVSADYEIESPIIAADTWCRLTVCAISDITGVQVSSNRTMNARIPGFVVYIDGKQAVASAGYSIGKGYRTDWLTPAARMLIGERGLFPWLVRRGRDDAMTLSSFSFSGQGAVDDLLFTTTRLGHIEADNVFTLKWDAGVKSMRCIVSTNSVPVSTNEIDAATTQRYWDCRLRTTNAVVTVTNVEYFAENGYSNGVWSAEANCRLEGDSFVCTGTNPVARVASSRNCVSLGGEMGYETFAEAKARAKTHPAVIELSTNVVVTTYVPGSTYQDRGYFTVTSGDDIVLDLHGFTLQGKGYSCTVLHQGGKLRIIDTEGGGAVLPPEGQTIAVKSISESQSGASLGMDKSQVLVMEAGRYAGEINLTTKGMSKNYSYCGTCVVDGGSYTNFNGGQTFYLEPCVTNTSLYFGRNIEDYWTVATNGFIWCGEGTNDLWTTAENWRGKAVPGKDDLAIFPLNTNDVAGWSVDFGSGVDTKNLWLDADIIMSGTNEFSDVSVLAGTNRLVGTGTATFTGKLPGRLISEGVSSEIRLGADWRGTVRISGITLATTLKDIMYWGVAGSKVEFAGVRGYLSDKADHHMPYELVLTDPADGTAAWKNDTGYTGSTVSFPKLSGSGTFESPKNLREILQVFQFRDVADFTGSFKLGGKRLLLGTGSAAKAARAGHFTFASQVAVRGGLAWTGVNAHFGTNIVIYGKLSSDGLKLMKYTGSSAPAVDAVAVRLINPMTGATNDTCKLEASGGTIKVVSGESVSVNGLSLMAESLPENTKAGDTFVVNDDVTIKDNSVLINGVAVADFADSYKLVGDGSTYTVQLDEENAAPTLAEVELVAEDGTAYLQVKNAKEGMWYLLQTAESLTGEWQDAGDWVLAEGDTLELDADIIGSAGFFRVIMTDRDPTGGTP